MIKGWLQGSTVHVVTLNGTDRWEMTTLTSYYTQQNTDLGIPFNHPASKDLTRWDCVSSYTIPFIFVLGARFTWLPSTYSLQKPKYVK